MNNRRDERDEMKKKRRNREAVFPPPRLLNLMERMERRTSIYEGLHLWIFCEEQIRME